MGPIKIKMQAAEKILEPAFSISFFFPTFVADNQIIVENMRFLATILALCLQLFCLAQTETTIPVSQEKTSPSEELPIKPIIIGYLSYDSVLTAMPQYTIVEKKMEEMTAQYDAELKRVEDEFNQKYEAFLDGRKDFPRTILLKRQTELQQLMQRNVEFREQSRRELQQARADALAPLRSQLSEAIADVARQRHIIVVVNTDVNVCPFFDPDFAVDISADVQSELQRR